MRKRQLMGGPLVRAIIRPRLLDKYSIKPSNERLQKMGFLKLYQIILDNLKHFKCAIYVRNCSIFLDFDFDLDTNEMK